MANLKEVRTRIDSVNSTMQITSAMKMVSASKLRKTQSVIMALRPYVSKMQEIMQNLTSSLKESKVGAYSEKRAEAHILIIPVTSNRGLCGAFNVNIIRATQNLIETEFAAQHQNGTLKLFCIGKKGNEFFRAKKYDVVDSDFDIFDNLSLETATSIAQKIMEQFESGKYDRVIFVYNQFKNASTQIITNEQFLPIETTNKKQTTDAAIDYIFEPDKTQIVSELVPKILKMQVYKILLDSFASEHGARMISMNKATDNAIELLKELRLSYNKARQTAITNEIVEIVGGAGALDD
ncbi:MAG: ATP synthase F1 subunit gamma [Lentimicrobiaceae bacterium]|jgi:F-type H+-transporting ATPase subunit gamma|nr:ATP synthase F1 subunit gamma [Lentimicrobiaceae bacterium]